ncbi:hypothetical protein MXB_2631 [Myxobolus squamalis]|nr:hypothetical protein MXB_2631 [Myxobolus squamalis]
MKVLVLPAGADNYMYLIHDERGNAAVVDPYNYRKVEELVSEMNLNLTHVLTTHHHLDHAGGNSGLLLCKPDLIVCGGNSRVSGVNMVVNDGTIIEIGSIIINCIKTPGHTNDHICYFANDKIEDTPPCIFSGDTLFIGGCGKIFEGTPSDMYESIVGKLSRLPPETLVYCGHEYTVKNLKFGLSVDPDNDYISAKLEWANNMRRKKLPTIPSTIEQEKNHNVFMRTLVERDSLVENLVGKNQYVDDCAQHLDIAFVHFVADLMMQDIADIDLDFVRNIVDNMSANMQQLRQQRLQK